MYIFSRVLVAPMYIFRINKGHLFTKSLEFKVQDFYLAKEGSF